jgi:DNA polymerase elongation subunit (family B)
LPEPKIALIDIETAPILMYAWTMFEANAIHVVRPTYIMCFAVKWAHQKQIKTFALCDYPGYAQDRHSDKALCKDLHKTLDEADIVVAHNGDAFDIKKINSRLVVHGFQQPSPFKTFDTLKVARKNFKFDSNKLDNIGGYLHLGHKMPHTGKHMWVAAMEGDPKAWAMMRKYNAQDVRLLDAVYQEIKPWAATQPDLRAYTGTTGCPSCLSKNVQCRGFNVAKTRKTQRMQCQDCGHWHSGRIIKDDIA